MFKSNSERSSINKKCQTPIDANRNKMPTIQVLDKQDATAYNPISSGKFTPNDNQSVGHRSSLNIGNYDKGDQMTSFRNN